MCKGFFVTGTDTGVGKTEMTLAIMQVLQDKGYKVNALKPIATDGKQLVDGLVNDDALRLQSQCSTSLAYKDVNPFCYEPAIAPHIAASLANRPIDLADIKGAYGKVYSQSDFCLVEGVGGWQVPINKHQTTVDIAKYINLPVIMVVGFRLGCLNHALLTYQAIKASRLKCIAWIANTIDPELQCMQENYQALKERIDAPCIGAIPFINQPETKEIAKLLHLEHIL